MKIKYEKPATQTINVETSPLMTVSNIPVGGTTTKFNTQERRPFGNLWSEEQ